MIGEFVAECCLCVVAVAGVEWAGLGWAGLGWAGLGWICSSNRGQQEPSLAADCGCRCLQLCLEVLVALALRNRDRLLLIWPLLHDHLAHILAPQARPVPSPAAFAASAVHL